MNTDVDVLVIGAGPNGLTCAAYLARCGLKVKVVEANVESGGGLMTQEISGFKVNNHAIYMLLAEQMPPFHDLELAKYGVSFIRPDAQAAFLFNDSSFVLYSDVDRSTQSISAISPQDAETFKQLYNDFKTACDAFIIPATYYPPVDPLEQIELLENSGAVGRWLNELAELSPREVIEGYDFKDERIEASLLYLTNMFGLDLDSGGMGFLTPIYVYRLLQAALVRGGSHQMASALRRAIEQYKGQIVTAQHVREIIVRDGVAKGVNLANGETVSARVIISSLNPEQNFLQLIDSREVPTSLIESSTMWEWDETSLFVANYGIVGDPPKYPLSSAADKALNVVMGIESKQDVIDHFNQAQNGKVPTGKIGHGSCPSLFDNLLAHNHLKEYGNCSVLRWECLAPYDVDWSHERQLLSERALMQWSNYAPNIKSANVRLNLPWSPQDIERHLPTMKRGSIKHGAYTSIQMGYNRPSDDCSSYRTPIENFYVCGASTHPGGMVLLGGGYNAANVVAHDYNFPVWWEIPKMVKEAINNGYLPRMEA